MGFPLQTYLQLQKDLGLDHELPVTADWSAAADFLFLIKEYCQNSKPATMAECSSGLTTLTLARCCQMNGVGKVYSLENGEQYALKTQQNLDQFGLGNYADVIHAPLENIEVNSTKFDWYSLNDLPDLSIDMLVIDGPPGFIQKHSRMPALPLLFDRLADGAVVFLDDAAREEERELVDMWLEMFPQLTHEYIESERGCSVLTVNKS